ncbi:YdcF family protein [Cognatiluteimonas profundi]|uniref:YdcF family protein n=1 Tax=Cognatiluteimonas profundi TaxID=2594501 RepID=UPI00131D8C85|nr:YdcF family protein [Lysobacter profundi]
MNLHKLLVTLTYPLALSAVLLALALVVLLLRQRKLAVAFGAMALGWSLLWSVPAFSDWLRQSLERRHPVVAEATLPRADAIVVLGGGSYEWTARPDVGPDDLVHSRLAAGARAWLGGRAPIIILSGGRGRPGHTEADLMAQAIGRLGIPASALLLEQHSRNTRDNAVFTAQLARQHGVHRVLLVTSSLHMPRASLLFRDAGVEVVPVSVPEPEFAPMDWEQRWLPTRSALWRSGRALKEYAGLLDVKIENRVDGPEPGGRTNCHCGGR